MLHAGSLEGPVPARVPVEAWAPARGGRPHVAPLAACRAAGADALIYQTRHSDCANASLHPLRVSNPDTVAW